MVDNDGMMRHGLRPMTIFTSIQSLDAVFKIAKYTIAFFFKTTSSIKVSSVIVPYVVIDDHMAFWSI